MPHPHTAVRRIACVAACAALVLLAACAKPEEQAADAVKAAETALAAVREQAAKADPETLAVVIAEIGGLEQKLASGDFAGVTAAAPAVMATLATLQEETAAKQAEMAEAMAAAKAQWDGYTAEVPKLAAQAQARIAELQKSLTLPPDLKQDTFAKGKAAFDAMTADWTAATEAYAAEDGAAAMALASRALEKGKEAVQLLGAGP